MGAIDQAGAIVVRVLRQAQDAPSLSRGADGSAVRVLLVTARRNPRHWILPKGHVEAGETLEEAAVREAREEAGVAGRLLYPAGTVEYTLGGDAYRVHYFWLSTRDPGQPEPGRSLAWCSKEEALERITFDDTRELVRRGWLRAQRMLSASS